MDRRRLDALLGGAELAWLLDRLVQRCLRGEPLSGKVVRKAPTPAERDAVDRLFGRLSGGATLTVSLDELERLLRSAGVAPGLREAVVALRSEELDERAALSAREAAWAAALAECRKRCEREPRLSAFWQRVASTGLLARVCERRPEAALERMSELERLVERLPARGRLLPELAAEIAGDAHALDAGTALGGLALQLVSVLAGAETAADAAARRDVWAQVGVLCDDLSSSVLVLNLQLEPGSLAGRALAVYRGEPCRLLLRHLLREPARAAAATVFVCENPAILARAAAALGAHGAPLVCTEGQPTTAVRLLLDGLRASGVTLRYHGDFDWPGLQIANLLLKRHQVEPWRMSADDYSAAPKGPPLVGQEVVALWDPALAARMRSDGRAVHEEAVAAPLLEDLAQSPEKE